MAHPDDEVLGCGGTLARAVEEGAKVTVLLPLKRRNITDRCSWETVCEQFEQAVKSLGCNPVILNSAIMEDFQSIHESQIANAIMPYVEEADMIFTHHGGDVHHSHKLISRAVEITTRPFRNKKWVFQCFILSSSDQGFYRYFVPNFYVQINEIQANKKTEAMGYYTSELTPGRDKESIMANLKTTGNRINSKYAEEFQIVRAYIN